MNLSPGKLLGFLACILLAGNAPASEPPIASSLSGHPGGPGCAAPTLPSPSPAPAPSPSPAPSPPGDRTSPQTTPAPGTPSTDTNAATNSQNQESQNQNQGAGENPYASAGEASRGVASNSVSAAGTGLASSTGVAAAGGAGRFNVVNFSTQHTPLILPGLFTAINAESAQPVDRIFASYGYFDSFKINTPSGPAPGFNLNRFDIGAEKTIFNGMGSIYVRVPFLWATSNSSGQPIDGVGDVSAGLKFALMRDRETGSTFTAGMTVSAPTGRNTVAPTTTFSSASPTLSDATVASSFPTPTTTINPTFLQPWVGGLLVLDRFYVQEYLAVVIPTDDRVATFINNDIGIGFRLFQSQCRDRWLTSITPTLDVQTLLPINHQGTPTDNPSLPVPPGLSQFTSANSPGGATPATLTNAALQSSTGVSLNSPYQVFVTAGVGLGLGARSLLSIGVVTPVTGPKAFTTGATIGFNLLF